MPEIKKEKPVISAGASSIFENVGDRKQVEIKIVKGERVDYPSKKDDGEQIVNLAWKFSAVLREDVDNDNLGGLKLNKEGNQIWLNLTIFFGKKNTLHPEDSKLYFQYLQFRDILFPEYDEIDKESLKGSEVLKAILKQKYFLIDLEAKAPYVSTQGTEYAQYTVKNIEDTMLNVVDSNEISADTVIGLWDE